MILPSVSQALERWASAQALPRQWALAYSGGADSSALLHAASALWPGRVRALHVNHGLQSAAADFEAHAQRVCADLGVPLRVLRVDAHPRPQQSPQDAARLARYRALADAAADWGLAEVWLAQHQDDQLETVLLALSRGAGVAGLAAMPQRFVRHAVSFVRPLLDVSGRTLRDELQAAGLSACEDPSNADPAYTRNRLRLQVVPALRAAFPSAAAMVARSATHMAQAQRLLDGLAQSDLTALGTPPSIRALRGLDADRRANVLRYWLKAEHATQASAAQLAALQRQIEACQTRGHDIAIKLGAGFVRRDGPRLIYLATL